MLSRPSIYTSILVASSLLHNTTDANNLFDKNFRIIGGSKAKSNRYPYTVALTTTGSNFFCGGSLIAPDVVLTAAHCLRGTGISYKVAIGKADLTKNDGEVIRVMKEIKHQQYYNWSTDSFDLGLLVLKKPVSVVSQDDLIRINADDAYPSPGDTSRIMGWGDTDPDEAKLLVSYSLREVDIPVISNKECKSTKGSANGYTGSYEDLVFTSMICTFMSGQDACQGDSGGPLIIPGSKASQDTLVGVISWGFGCGIFPGVSARVSKAFGWISETVCEESTNPPSYLCVTSKPTAEPILEPTTLPSLSIAPSNSPSFSPTFSIAPSSNPSANPSRQPSLRPSNIPTISVVPSLVPTETPTLPSPLNPKSNITLSPTPKPTGAKGNSLMIPISELMPREVKDAETKLVNVEQKSGFDDDDFSASNGIGVDNLPIEMLMGAVVSAILMS